MRAALLVSVVLLFTSPAFASDESTFLQGLDSVRENREWIRSLRH